MTKITEIQHRGGTVAWSPIASHPDLLALGAKVRLPIPCRGGDETVGLVSVKDRCYARANTTLTPTVHCTYLALLFLVLAVVPHVAGLRRHWL
jgi:hypothetical protein